MLQGCQIRCYKIETKLFTCLLKVGIFHMGHQCSVPLPSKGFRKTEYGQLPDIVLLCRQCQVHTHTQLMS